ncbi:MAG TPA: ArsC/Spx/MgsR family protein [Mycobacteriales bacterium]|nr:ArsC/Spx/MgsR family protein [Mycobacteriales bacterium]
MELWFNPRCSKCRTAREMLDAAGVRYTVRDYLADPPNPDELTALLARLGLEPWDLARTGEPVARDLGLGELPRTAATRHRWIELMAAHPVVVQRPILVTETGDAYVARSPEAVTAALSKETPSNEPLTTETPSKEKPSPGAGEGRA